MKAGGIGVFMVCKNCNKRKIGCHSVCKEYIAEKEQIDRRNEIIKQARIRDADLRVVERMKGRE